MKPVPHHFSMLTWRKRENQQCACFLNVQSVTMRVTYKYNLQLFWKMATKEICQLEQYQMFPHNIPNYFPVWNN